MHLDARGFTCLPAYIPNFCHEATGPAKQCNHARPCNCPTVLACNTVAQHPGHDCRGPMSPAAYITPCRAEHFFAMLRQLIPGSSTSSAHRVTSHRSGPVDPGTAGPCTGQHGSLGHEPCVTSRAGPCPVWPQSWVSRLLSLRTSDVLATHT